MSRVSGGLNLGIANSGNFPRHNMNFKSGDCKSYGNFFEGFPNQEDDLSENGNFISSSEVKSSG